MVRRGWRVEEDISTALWKQLLRGPIPPAHCWPRASRQVRSDSSGPGRRQSVWLLPHGSTHTQKFSRASPSPGHTGTSGFRSIHEGVQTRAMHRPTQPRRHRRVEVVASCLREGPCTDGSPSSCQTGGGLRTVLHQSKTTFGESSRNSQSSSRGGGQVRAGTSGGSAEEDLRAAAAPLPVNPGTVDPPPTMVAEVSQLRAAVQALTRERDDLRANRLAEGQPTQTVLALGSPENRNASNVMVTLIEEADTDLRRSQERFAPY